MPVVDVKPQTSSEFRKSFNDWLDYYVNNTFNSKDQLYFVTYQPDKPELSSDKVIEDTLKLFGSVPYVAVIEQTFEEKKLLKCAQYIDGYHSHILITEKDYNALKHTLNGKDIVAKVVYDLSGLTNRYLVKQAGNTHNRQLPIQNLPHIINEPIEQSYTVSKISKFIIKSQTQINLRMLPIQKIGATTVKNINKIYWMHMFIDDT